MKKRKQIVGWSIVAVAMALAALLSITGLDNHLFWDDEATTAIYARNLIEQGRITAYDGTNLVGYSYGGGLGEDLGQELRVPPLPAFVAAGGMLLFGQNTFGGRIMFAIAGVISILVTAVWARRHFGNRFPFYLPPLVLSLSTAYLLYVRNCRYYALAWLFTVAVLAFWAGKRTGGDPFDTRSLLRYAGGALSLVLLTASNYLAAGAVMLCMLLFFAHRRYRQQRQYVMLGAMLLAAAIYGGLVLVFANPFSASYGSEGSLFEAPYVQDFYSRTLRHLWMLLRDLGTHEFFPWLLVLPLFVPLVPQFRRLRSLAFRGWMLVAFTVLYVILAALLTPPDMGKGESAEMRYVVPLIILGTAVSAVSLLILWRTWRPTAIASLALLLFSNILHLGFVQERFDNTSSLWPPSIYRYTYEITHDYTSGNEAMIGLLEQLPEGTTVKILPEYMAYPPMFYVPELRYCDQLTKEKPISEELLPLPAYLYKELSLPEVVIAPAPFLVSALAEMSLKREGDIYHVQMAMPEYWNYTSKPEIPYHFFARPDSDWRRYPGMTILAREGADMAVHEVLLKDFNTFDVPYRLGMVMAGLGQDELAASYYAAALKADPERVDEFIELGILEAERGLENHSAVYYSAVLQFDPKRTREFLDRANLLTIRGAGRLATPYYRAVLSVRRKDTAALVGLGQALAQSGKHREAEGEYRKALKIDPELTSARIYLAALQATDRVDEAKKEYRKALELLEDDSQLADGIRLILKRLGD